MPLEVCIDTAEAAYECIFGEADRIEICGELSVGGLTPSIGMFEQIFRIHRSWNVRHRVMIRPRSGDFCYSDNEFEAMKMDIAKLRERGAQGFVFGALNPDYTLDERKMRELIAAANGLPCTLHRCFDWTADWRVAMTKAAELGFDTILTSGQKPTVGEAIETLGQMAQFAETLPTRIDIMAGSGLDDDSLRALLSHTRIRWFHGSASSPIKQTTHGAPPFSMGPQDKELRKMADRNVVKLLKKIIIETD